MAQNGLFAKLSCEEVPNKDGTSDVKFEGSTQPISSGGTETFVKGVLHADGRLDGELLEIDNGHVVLQAHPDGTGLVGIPSVGPQRSISEIAKDALKGPAAACKRSLGLIPGVSG